MTKKHFIELAELMKRNKHLMRPMAYRIMCEEMADFCARNHRVSGYGGFNRAKFLDACMYNVDDGEMAA